uniref:Uncharacterized protein n=1 Tax=Sinocyclocheilus anshuiensis TaxID=1608454 RepID=A0A671SMW0_9TELE
MKGAPKDHEAQRLSLQAEINTLMAQLADLARKHEKTCTEVCVVLDVVYDSFHSTYLHMIKTSQVLFLKSLLPQVFQVQREDWERKHKTVVSIYRSHLLAAVQGRMDEEVQALLLQILRMTQKGQN